MRAFNVTEGERLVLEKKPHIEVDDWAYDNIIVMDGPYAGSRMRREMNPYLSSIMRAWYYTQHTSVCGGPQTGKTLFLYACMAFAVARMPGTKMLAMPDEGALEDVLTDKLKPMLKKSPGTRRLLDKIKTFVITLKDGSNLYFRSASSKGQRASITVKHLFLDERDLYPAPSLTQGNAVKDFLDRTNSYGDDAKIASICAPKGGVESSIWQALITSDQIYAYQGKCPACGQSQFITPSGLLALPFVDEDGTERAATAHEIKLYNLGRYRCAHCGDLWSDIKRDAAILAGHWTPASLSLAGQEVEVREAKVQVQAKTRGFWLPGILSSTVKLSAVAAEARTVQESDAPDEKQDYLNSRWALPYTAVIQEPKETVIRSRMADWLPARMVPPGAIALTAGIDTQKVGFYFLVMAWMRNMHKYIIDYGRLHTFDDIRRLLWETCYPRLGTDGQTTGEFCEIWRAGIDTGGTSTAEDSDYSRTEEVYEFVRWCTGDGALWATKGASREMDKAVRFSVQDRMPSTGKLIPNGLNLVLLDTNKLKSSFFSSLLNPLAHRPVHIYGFDPELANNEELHKELIIHLCSEREEKTSKGARRWVQIHKNNHYLDCAIIAAACGNVNFTPSLHHYLMQEDNYQAGSVDETLIMQP